MPFDGSPPKQRSFLQWLGVFFCGMCMGAADIVPGISGGTVAFIIGVYAELLESLKSFNSHAFGLLAACRLSDFLRAVRWQFLLALVGGIAVSFFTLAQLFHGILGDETYRVYLYAAFLGLILASVWFCARQLSRWTVSCAVCLLLGAAAAYALTGTSFAQKSSEPLYSVHIALKDQPLKVENYADNQLLNVPESIVSAMLFKGIIPRDTTITNVAKETSGPARDFVAADFPLGLDLWLMCCGAIAISAMLLPGISGSYLLTILGAYGVVIAALADFISGLKAGFFEAEAFFVLFSMLLGIIVGAIVFSRLVSWMLKHYHDGTIATLTGFMVGALGSVWPFWSYAYYYLPLKLEKGPQLEPFAPIMPDFQSPLFFNACIFAAVGFMLVFALERLATLAPKSAS